MSSNKDNNLALFGAILSGFVFGLAISYFYSERQKHLKEKLAEIQKNANNGFNTDRQNLESDWKVIGSDLRKSYTKVLNEQS